MLVDLDADTRSDMITWTATPRRVKDTCSASRQRTGHPVINQPSRHYAEALGCDVTQGVRGRWSGDGATGDSLGTPSCRELTTFVFRGGGLSPQAVGRPRRSGMTIGSCPWSLSATDNYFSCGSAGTQ